jgi:hypothetical protein
VLLAAHPQGHVAIAQPAHGWMCGQLARAWGNERFGPVVPFEEVCLAAEQHDTDWADWELAPTLDPDTGLPHTFRSAPLDVHLEIHRAGPRRLVGQSRYAALLVSLHHLSFFATPGRVGRLRGDGRRIEEYRRWHEAFQAEQRATLAVDAAELQRNHRLVRTWDGLSHDLILDLAPRTRRDVPVAGGGRVDLEVGRRGDVFTIDPWPFAEERVVVRTEGRLLEGTFADEAELHAALARAAWVDLGYVLEPA